MRLAGTAAAVLLAAAAVAGVWVARTQSPQRRVGQVADRGVVLPTGESVRPDGPLVLFGRRPVAVLSLPERGLVLMRDHQGITVVRDGQRPRFVALPAGSSLTGLALAPDTGRVWSSDAAGGVHEMEVDGAGLRLRRTLTMPAGPAGAPYPCGLAFGPSGELYVALNRSNRVAVVDTATGAVRETIPTPPAPVELRVIGGVLWISCWGRAPVPGGRSALSSGTRVAVDARGAAAGGSVVAWTIARRTARRWDVPAQPGAAVADGDGALVPCADGGAVVRLSEASSDPRWWRGGRGESPTSLLRLGDGRLAVALGGANAVAILDPATRRVVNRLRTAWYPLALAQDRAGLRVACAKGVGSRRRDLEAGALDALGETEPATESPSPADRHRHGVYGFTGALATLDPDARGTAADPPRPVVRPGRGPVPVPTAPGQPSVFRHVVYILKENRTYDSIFGDVPEGDGDPGLALYGARVTPNHHRIARDFVLLDNFYCNGVLSADGHSWATEGNATSFFERSFGAWARSYPYGDEPLAISSTGHLWDHVLEKGRGFVNFGEYDTAGAVRGWGHADLLRLALDPASDPARYPVFGQAIGIERVRRHTHRAYPGWNMRIPDLLRARIFLAELRRMERRGVMPALTVVYLPQDHTSGAEPGAPTPAAHVADNDLALGRVVEGLTRSRFWKQMAIFVVEDDPQDGLDHVDGHRSPCLVVSPWSRGRGVSHRFHNQAAALRTMKQILGIDLLTRFEAMAEPMTDCFGPRPDFRPWSAVPARTDLFAVNPARSSSGPRRDLSRPDRIDEDAFNREQWALRRPGAPYPAERAGAHGRGLAGRGLRLSPDDGTPEPR